MTEPTLPSPTVPKGSHRTRNIGIATLIIGLIIGLALGVFVSVLFNLPSSFHTGAGVNNQVQVSGTVSEIQTGTIQFDNLNATIRTSGQIVNGHYSVLLVGGQSYSVTIYNGSTYYYSKYIPLDVSTFTANF
jgi:hypothetical protein